MRRDRPSWRSLAIAALAVGLSACNGNSGFSSGAPSVPLSSPSLARVQTQVPPKRVHHRGSSGKIQHVVIVIQENRSFNNLLYGFPGATTTTYGYNTAGQKITLQPVVLETTWDIIHDSSSVITACHGTGSMPGTDCRMNGFNKETWACGGAGEPHCPIANPPYAYVPHSETKPYFDMGKQYVVADQMYASNFDASSFISHQYIIAAQAEASVNYPFSTPWGCPGPSGEQIATVGPKRQIPYGYESACYNVKTLGQEADDAKISWAYYTSSHSVGMWNAFDANKYVYDGADWKNDVIAPPSQFLTDVSNGKLRQITWVTPTFTNSDHPGSGSSTGPQWVASVVNAIGQSKYWNNTAIFIFWDDYGGWYDPEPPAYVDYDGLGFRLPMIVVSPYAKQGYVSHVHYEHGSILRFVEDQFGLGRLSASDTRATSPAKDCFNFNLAPRKFQVIPTVLGKDYFLHQPLDPRPADTQ